MFKKKKSLFLTLLGSVHWSKHQSRPQPGPGYNGGRVGGALGKLFSHMQINIYNVMLSQALLNLPDSQHLNRKVQFALYTLYLI